MFVKMFIHIAFAVLLTACAAALVPYTSDPYKMLDNAQALAFSQNRPIPAEKLALQALASFTKENDSYGEAEGHHFLGNFYKSPQYKDSKYFKNDPNYDSTSTKSIEHFRIAAEKYKQEKDMWGVSKAIFGMGNGYGIDGNSVKECELYNEALITYKNAVLTRDTKGRLHLHPVNPKYKDMAAMIRAFLKAGNCTEANP